MLELQDVTTGVISDTHIPGHLDGALGFLQRTFKEHGVQQIIHIGDLMDHHYISRHPIELDALSPAEEWERSLEELKKWVTAFPRMHLCIGNHDQIPTKRLKEVNMPADVYLRPFNELYGLPDTWVWDRSFKLFGSVLVEHGLGSGGMYGAKNTANKLGVSYVQGHTHSHAGVFDIPRPFKNAAAMNVGCLVDELKYFSRYGEDRFKVPVSTGCGIIYNENHMEFVPYGN